MSQPLPMFLDLKKTFEAHCVASGDCLGAILSQEDHLIAYESRRLHAVKQDLGIYEKELLMVIHEIDSWKHYLLKRLLSFILIIKVSSIL